MTYDTYKLLLLGPSELVGDGHLKHDRGTILAGLRRVDFVLTYTVGNGKATCCVGACP
jgi:hypothetical protein